MKNCFGKCRKLNNANKRECIQSLDITIKKNKERFNEIKKYGRNIETYVKKTKIKIAS